MDPLPGNSYYRTPSYSSTPTNSSRTQSGGGNAIGQVMGKTIGIAAGRAISRYVFDPIKQEIKEVIVDPIRNTVTDAITGQMIEISPEITTKLISEQSLGDYAVRQGLTTGKDSVLDSIGLDPFTYSDDVATQAISEATVQPIPEISSQATGQIGQQAGEQAGQQIAGEAGNSMTDAIIPGIGTALGAYSTYDAIKDGEPVRAGISGGLTGLSSAALAGTLGATGMLASGAVMGPVGLLVGAALAAGQEHRWGKGRKDLAKKRREAIQGMFDNRGFLEDGWMVGPDGQRVYVHEGSPEDARISYIGGLEDWNSNVIMTPGDRAKMEDRLANGYHYGDTIDFTDPEVGRAIANSRGLALLMTGSGENDLDQITASYLINALKGSDEEKQQQWVKDKFATMGYNSAEEILQSIGKLVEEKKVDPFEARVAGGTINRMYGVPHTGPVHPKGFIDVADRQFYEDHMRDEARKTNTKILDRYIDDEGYAMDLFGNTLREV